MKIAFDSQLFLKGNKTGIAWCADNIVKKMSKRQDTETVCDYFVKNCEEDEKNVRIYQKYGASMNPCKKYSFFFYKLIWPFIPIPYSLFFGKDRDITQFFNFVVPPGVPGKSVTIVHDMAYKAHPETLKKKNLRWLQLTLKRSCKRADAIVTVSEFSKNEIVKFLRIKPDKITVMPNGVDLELFHPDYSQIDVQMVKDKYKIAGSYFLYLGTLEPRKNIERVVEAYAKLCDDNKEIEEEIPKLVLAGGKGWLYESIFEAVKKYGISSNVIFTGYVREEEIPLLMVGAISFLFPSLYEGFGMPVLEAMACGTPVLTSNTTSLPEVAGDAGILVDPYSIEEIRDKMLLLWQNRELRQLLSKRGIERAANYTWENSTRILYELYEKLLA
ncbi:glycosyltransferase family 4 protein [Hungatella effluvii]|uniref:glycosyltransferase family 4 protein n=1 Tax=Hungatella effluvii TaxID=1096246 RepID=UPI0022E51E92|nr:glycosyltransferase family 1 protein [Hungatella effluvii]